MSIVEKAEQIPGWMSGNDLEWLLEQARKFDTIVEIGCWMGRSTFALCSGKAKVFVVDHFKGSSEHQEQMRDMASTGVTLKEVFMENCGHFPNMEVIVLESTQAAKLFEDRSVDMVFIDGSHEEDLFYADLVAWVPKATKMVCGHDRSYPDIKAALNRYFPNRIVGLAPGISDIWMVEL